MDPQSGYYAFGANERYEFIAPYPGIWQLTSTNCDGIDVYYDEVEILPTERAPITQIPQFDREPYYNPDDPYYLDYQLLDSSNNGIVVPQSEKELFAINVVANVTSPSGEQNSYTLRWDAVNQTFRADQPLLVPVEGTYRYSIIGTTRRHDGAPTVFTQNESQVFDQVYDVFKLENIEFTAQDVFPVRISTISPVVDDSVGNVHNTILGGWPLKELPLTIRVKLVDESGNTMINVSDILVAPDNSIRATLKYSPPPSPEGQGLVLPEQVSQPVTLVPDPDTQGEFIGTISDLSYVGPFQNGIESSDASHFHIFRRLETNRPSPERGEWLSTNLRRYGLLPNHSAAEIQEAMTACWTAKYFDQAIHPTAPASPKSRRITALS